MALNEKFKKYRKEAGTIRKIADLSEISPVKVAATPLTIEEQIDEYIKYKRGLEALKGINRKQ